MNNKILITEARGGLNQLRYEVADELGIGTNLPWNKIDAADRVTIGRNMSKKLFEKGLAEYLKQSEGR